MGNGEAYLPMKMATLHRGSDAPEMYLKAIARAHNSHKQRQVQTLRKRSKTSAISFPSHERISNSGNNGDSGSNSKQSENKLTQ